MDAFPDKPSAPETFTPSQVEVWKIALSLASRIANQTLAPYHDSENLAADIALKAFLMEQSGRLPISHDEKEAYIATMTRNKVTDEYRSTGRRNTYSSGLGNAGDDEQGLPERVSNLGTTEQAERASANAFDAILSQAPLSNDQRAVLRLKHVHDLTSPTIAELLGLPETTVRTRLFRAYRTLKECYPDQSILRDLISS